MAQKEFRYSVSCGGGSCKSNNDHVHNISVSNLNEEIKNNIPANAIIRSRKLQLNYDHKYSLSVGYAEVDIGVYFSDGGRANGTLLVDLETFRARKDWASGSHTWDMSERFSEPFPWFSETYPFGANTSKPYLSICFMTDNLWAANITCTNIEIIIEYDTYADFVVTGGDNVPGDIVYALDSNGTNIGTRAQIENNSDITIYARSYDGRKIVSVRVYDNTDDKDIWTQDGDELLQYLSEDGCVLNYPLSIEDYYVGKSWIFWVVFEEVLYVTYDNHFNYLKWFHEGLSEADVVNKTATTFTIKQSDSDAAQYVVSPMFKIKQGINSVAFDFTTNCDNPNVCIETKMYDNNMTQIMGGSIEGYTSGDVLFIDMGVSSYIQFYITNTTVGSEVTYSNFVMCPRVYNYDTDCYDYEYMLTSLPASKRAQSGKWNMPTPTREGYEFKGWNTEPDGSGITYTSNMSFPTEDLALYSQWEQVANAFVGNQLVDIYVGDKLADIYIGTTLV